MFCSVGNWNGNPEGYPSCLVTIDVREVTKIDVFYYKSGNPYPLCLIVFYKNETILGFPNSAGLVNFTNADQVKGLYGNTNFTCESYAVP